MIQSPYPKIAITGTKGKTTIARILDYVYQGLYEQVLRVDTSGAYLNGQLQVTEAESIARWGYTPTNAPGRFLGEINSSSNISILECTLFCGITGLGYSRHDVGIFTNVFEDHLGGIKSLRTKADIAEKKSFIFKKIAVGGVAVFNADDPLVAGQLIKIPEDRNIKTIGVTLSDKITGNSLTCSVKQDEVLISSKKNELFSFKTSEFTWVMTSHIPSLYTLGFVVATLFTTLTDAEFKMAIERLKEYSFDPEGGRMVRLQIQKGPMVLMDFAHEKHSLKELAKYAKTLIQDDGKLIGVLRLAPSRTDELIKDTAECIASEYDAFVIYDKVDGYFREAKMVKGYIDKKEKVGIISKLFSDSLKEHGATHVNRVLREDEAIEKAVSIATEKDVIIYIANDDSKRSLSFLKEATGGRKVETL